MRLETRLIQDASRFLKGRIRRTPLELSHSLSTHFGSRVYLKLENLQLTGSFKIRGAFYKLSCLDSSSKAKGVGTCSAGNHGKAIAYAGKELGVPVSVFVPSSIDPVKRKHMLDDGAEVVVSEFPGFDDTQKWAIQKCKELGKTFVSAYDDEEIMAGNGGSLGMEIAEDLPSVQTVLSPVGGGGLVAGIVKALPRVIHIGCQLAASPALRMSLDRGAAVTELPSVPTLAGGLEGGLGARPFQYLKDAISDVVLVKEEDLYKAMRWLLENHQYVVEPSGAAALAAFLFHKPKAEGDTVIVLSGRNVAIESYEKALRA